MSFPEPEHAYGVEPAELKRHLGQESLTSAKAWDWSRWAERMCGGSHIIYCGESRPLSVYSPEWFT